MPAFIVPERSQRILLTSIDLDTVAPPGSAVRVIERVGGLPGDTSEIEAQREKDFLLREAENASMDDKSDSGSLEPLQVSCVAPFRF